MRPITETCRPPVPGDCAARHRVDYQSGIRGTCAAVYGGTHGTVDWALVGDLSDRGGVRLSVRNVPRVVLSVDAENMHETMSVYGRGEGEGGGKEGEEYRGGLHSGG